MLIFLARSIRRFGRSSSGSMTVEFVATLPIILAALAFIFEFGRAVWAHQIVTKGVRDASRYISRAAITAGNEATIKTQAENLAKTGQLTSGGTVGFPWNNGTTFTIDLTVGSYTTPDYANDFDVAQVSAAVPMDLAMLAFMGIGTSYIISTADQTALYGE